METSKHALKEARREEKLQQQEQTLQERHHLSRKKRTFWYSIIGLLGIFFVIMIFLFVQKSAATPGPYDAFAQCLTEKDAVMYGAYWCPHCAEQKKMFGKSFEYIRYVECDPQGKNAQPEVCRQNGIESYPAWIIARETYRGTQTLQQLADATECRLA